jgi:hypothetical protein
MRFDTVGRARDPCPLRRLARHFTPTWFSQNDMRPQGLSGGRRRAKIHARPFPEPHLAPAARR